MSAMYSLLRSLWFIATVNWIGSFGAITIYHVNAAENTLTYHVSHPVKLSADAPKSGLGTVLMQNNAAIACATKAFIKRPTLCWNKEESVSCCCLPAVPPIYLFKGTQSSTYLCLMLKEAGPACSEERIAPLNQTDLRQLILFLNKPIIISNTHWLLLVLSLLHLKSWKHMANISELSLTAAL